MADGARQAHAGKRIGLPVRTTSTAALVTPRTLVGQPEIVALSPEADRISLTRSDRIDAHQVAA